MKRIIVDYAKLNNEILSLLVEKFPEGYEDSDVIRFKNAQNEQIVAVEVRTEDTIYLVKVSKKLATRIENYDEDEILEELDVITPDKKLDLDEDIDEVEVDDEDKESIDDDDEDDGYKDQYEDENDEDEDDVDDEDDNNEEEEEEDE